MEPCRSVVPQIMRTPTAWARAGAGDACIDRWRRRGGGPGICARPHRAELSGTAALGGSSLLETRSRARRGPGGCSRGRPWRRAEPGLGTRAPAGCATVKGCVGPVPPPEDRQGSTGRAGEAWVFLWVAAQPATSLPGRQAGCHRVCGWVVKAPSPVRDQVEEAPRWVSFSLRELPPQPKGSKGFTETFIEHLLTGRRRGAAIQRRGGNSSLSGKRFRDAFLFIYKP